MELGNSNPAYYLHLFQVVIFNCANGPCATRVDPREIGIDYFLYEYNHSVIVAVCTIPNPLDFGSY
jgi:hypothetical protein